MIINLKCPKCGKILSAKSENAGKKGKCSCGAIIVIPSETISSEVTKKDDVSPTSKTELKNADGEKITYKGFIDNKQIGEYSSLINLDVDENLIFFAESITFKSDLSGILGPHIYLAITNKRISALAKDKKDKTFIYKTDVHNIRWIGLEKKWTKSVVKIFINDPDERFLELEFLTYPENRKDKLLTYSHLEEMNVYIKSHVGGFKEPLKEEHVARSSVLELQKAKENEIPNNEFIDKKLLEEYSSTLNLETNEALFFFAAVSACSTHFMKSELSVSSLANLFFAVTNKRIIVFHKDKENKIFSYSKDIHNVLYIHIVKKMMKSEIHILTNEPKEKLFVLEFKIQPDALTNAHLEKMIEYIKTIVGGFKEPQDRIKLLYIGGHPDCAESLLERIS